MASTKQQHSKNRRSGRRRWLFRLAAIGLGLSPLLVLELVFFSLDWGRPETANDPFIGFAAAPLFVLNETGDRYETAFSRQEFFLPQSFPVHKSANTFRIFCLGGSTVQGRPYANETAFPAWLALSLKAADDSRVWEVLNCGGVSYASYRLAPIMEETLHYQPDLYIIYTGHNEFLEDLEFASIQTRMRWLPGVHAAMAHSRTYNLLRSAGQKALGRSADDGPLNREQLKAEVDALLDHNGGLADYHRDDAKQRAIVSHFENNLRRMVGLARQAGVPVILTNPVSNLKDCPPFKSASSPNLSEAERRRVADLRRKAANVKGSRSTEKVELLEEAAAIDARNAALLFELAGAYESIGENDHALAYYIRAQDEDICPLRMLEALHEVLSRVARQTDTPLVDARKLFAAQAQGAASGDDLLLDHVHPRIEGHQRLAAAFLEKMRQMGSVSPAAGWQKRRTSLYQDQLDNLPFGYYVRGQERLVGLKLWTQGRARHKPEKD